MSRPASAERWRQLRFEDLEARYLMTADGWEPPLLAVGNFDSVPELAIPKLELHGQLTTESPASPTLELLDHLDSAESEAPVLGCGFINLFDYNGNLLSNWQELVREHEHSCGHDHGDHEDHDDHETELEIPSQVTTGILDLAPDLDPNEIPIHSQYSLWNSKWPQSSLGAAVTITYSYSNILDGTFNGLTTDQIKAAIEKCFQVWSTYAPLNFVEVVDSGPAVSDTGYTAGSTPNIRIGHHAIDGASQVLAHAYYPQGSQGLSGDMHFDSAETWRIGAGGGGIDFVEVALHEMGHALGLQHEATNTAIMNAYYGGRFASLNSAFLLTDDINGIRALYGTGTGSVTPLHVNHTPTLNAINDVTMSRSQNQVVVAVSASDSDGDVLSYSATATQQAAVDVLAQQLDQQYQFSLNGSDYYNYRGAGEKYVVGANGQWYFILADGSLYSWSNSIAGSTKIATLDSSFHTTLSKLYNPQAGGGAPVNVVLSWNGANLTIDPASNFTGTFRVTVTASDGNASANQSFNVTVSNQTPTLAVIADQSMRPSDDSINVALSFADGDSDALTVTASVSQADATKASAYSLDQQHQFQAAPNEYYNARGAGEKYFQNASGSWFFILANGEVHTWNGTIAGSPLLATLDSRFHADLSLLHSAQQELGAPNNVVLSVNGSTLTVNPPAGYTGSFTVTVSVTDGAATTQRTFQLSVANHAPTVTAIADQSISPAAGSKTIAISASDSDNDTIQYSATAVQVDATQQLAYSLDQQYQFRTIANDYYNARGAGERYFQDGSANWYFILANGEVHSWNGAIGSSPLLGTLTGSYHSNLALLCSATSPVQQSINAGLTWNGSSLTLSPPNGFTGSFQVTVTASDGSLSSSRSFTVTVANNAPTIATIANQTMSPSTNSIQVAVNATDGDGDSVSLSATATQVDAVAQTAYSLDQQYNFQAAPGEYLGYRGASEKYFQDASGNWYFILPNASVYAWTTSIANSTLLGTVDASYYSTVSKLFNVAAPTGSPVNVGLQFSNGVLTIDPAANFTGTFQVTVTATDGSLSTQRSFQVTVANQAPTLASIANQTMTTSQDFISVAYSATDIDGDPLTVTASAYQLDATAQAAYNLDQQYGFVASASEYYNLRGAGEKYFQGSGGTWYFMLSGGQVYQWGGSIAGSSLVSTLNSSYYANLSLLHQATQPSQTPVNVVLSASNGVLTVNPAANFTGQFTVTVTASDGTASAARSFNVTVTGAGGMAGSYSAPPAAAAESWFALSGLEIRAAKSAGQVVYVAPTPVPAIRPAVTANIRPWSDLSPVGPGSEPDSEDWIQFTRRDTPVEEAVEERIDLLARVVAELIANSDEELEAVAEVMREW